MSSPFALPQGPARGSGEQLFQVEPFPPATAGTPGPALVPVARRGFGARMGFGLRSLLLWVGLALSFWGAGGPALAATQLSPLVQQLVEACARFGARSGLQLAAREGAESALEAAAARLAPRLLSEGGEALAQRTLGLVDELGPNLLHVLDGQALRRPIIEALEAVPKASRSAALSALLREGPSLGRALVQAGSEALEAELRHPGIGANFVEVLGSEGAALARALPSDDLAVLARYRQQIAQLPSAQRQGLVEALGRNARGVCDYLRAHPGFALSSATVALLLSNSDRTMDILEQGASQAGEIAANSIQRITLWVAPVLAAALGLWLFLRIRRSEARENK